MIIIVRTKKIFFQKQKKTKRFTEKIFIFKHFCVCVCARLFKKFFISYIMMIMMNISQFLYFSIRWSMRIHPNNWHNNGYHYIVFVFVFVVFFIFLNEKIFPFGFFVFIFPKFMLIRNKRPFHFSVMMIIISDMRKNYQMWLDWD